MYLSRMVRILLVLVGTLVGWASTARADAIHVVGTTDGCFGAGCSSFSSSTTLAGLTFTGTGFDVTTDSSGSVSISNLGGFTLDRNIVHNYNSDTFLLRVLFTLPSGTVGGGGTYAALLSGNINQNHNGTVTIAFDHNFQLFTYSNPSGHGSFEFGITNDPVFKTTGPSDPTIRGAIRNATFAAARVPEPASLLLFGSGVGLVAARLRRRFSGT